MVILPAPMVFIFPAVGEIGPPKLPVRVESVPVPVEVIVRVFPDPETVIGPDPKTFKTFPAGMASPAFDTNVVGTLGGKLPEVTFKIPACDIIDPLGKDLQYRHLHWLVQWNILYKIESQASLLMMMLKWNQNSQ
jgi:hypothetical protein